MKTTNDLIQKLNLIDWVKVDSKTLKSSDGWELSYSFKLLTSPPFADDYPVQIVIRVSKNGVNVVVWGLENNEENRLFVNFIEDARSKAWNSQYLVDNKNEATYKAEFDNL